VRGSDPGSAPAGLWLLIGNSRWHWARGHRDCLDCWSEPPLLHGASPRPLAQGDDLRGWAAVGPLPREAGWLEPGLRLEVRSVPLADLPAWVGIDRALVAWRAWQLSQGPVLVADVGTALSFTRVSGLGAFAGGRIQAGRSLQLRSLAEGTALLPSVTGFRDLPLEVEAAWPQETVAALERGVCEGLVAAVERSWQQARGEEPACQLWITGGDGAWLARSLGHPCHPNLALEALAALS
jgi:type III pantothenate kinase